MLNRPRNIDNKYNSYVLLKFYDEEWCVDSLREGNLFMRSQDSFSKMKDVGRGDELEDKNFVVVPGEDRITKMKYVERDGEHFFEFSQCEKKSEDDKGIYFLAFNNASKQNKIFSLYALWFNSSTGEINEIDKKMIDEFGSECCVIYKPSEFYKRVVNVDPDNTVVDFVKYIDLKSNPIQDWTPYTKDFENYGHQSEVRVLLKTLDEEESILHNLGVEIDDISVKCDALRFIEKFSVQNGQLAIPIKK